MKPSRYNRFLLKDQKIFLYNQLSESLLEIDNDLYHLLSSPYSFTSLPDDIKNYLKDICVIVEDDLDERLLIKLANLRSRYDSDFLRITILPTLSCNFRCWYCYETHKPSRITKEGVDSILNFIKKETLAKRKKHIILDWFGGEPLLCFETVIYPMSLKLIEWCKSLGITLHNMITTNGSLITSKNSGKMKDINLTQFQITLDGGRDEHNKTRYSRNIKDSYTLIINNIHSLCHSNPSVDIELRLNYTPENIHSLESVLEEFSPEVRGNIKISPHVVWQKSDCIEAFADLIRQLVEKAQRMGYRSENNVVRRRCVSCYTENADQYVVNYDLSVYKCTARDYDKDHSIGEISSDGTFYPNSLYYKYIAMDSPFLNPQCLQCDILPSCLMATGCLQKKIEGSSYLCCRSFIEQEIDNYLNQKIEQHEASN